MATATFLGYTGIELLRVSFAAMVAILFLQSSIDKLLHYKGETAYLTGHFAKSPLRSLVPLMLPLITVIELSAGLCAAISLFWQLAAHTGLTLGLMGMALGAMAIILLFFGQRMAKDYAGAAALVPYFLLCAAGIWVYAA